MDNNAAAGRVAAGIPEDVPGAEQEEGQQPLMPLMIMLLGKGGVGKSCSGNTILGQQAFKSEMKLKGVTVHCEKKAGTVNDVPVDVTEKVRDVPVAVIDTPGFFEKDADQEDNVRKIMQCVKLQEPGLRAFVLVVPIGRMTQEDQHTNALIEARFGPRVWDYTIVLFTHGDRLDEKTINDVITESDEALRSFIRKCGGGFHVFNNKNPQDQAQVTSFIAKIQTMVALNGGRHYNTALYPKEERSIRERQVSILAERDAEISHKEKMLQDRFQGAELETKKNELWRREENRARLEAEKQTRRNSIIWKILIFILYLIVAICLVGLALPNALPVAVPFIILLWIVYEWFPSISAKITWLSKKKKE